MDDQHQDPPSHVVPEPDQRTEPVRSRWTPKPEQILILESIFNSGMVNPPKEETVRIRKLLEKFGTVGDANVFYWFQNRRSRSRRRQRQIQASLNAAAGVPQEAQPRGGGGGIQNDHPYKSSSNSASSCDGGFLGGLNYPMSSSTTSCYVGSGTCSSSSSSSSSCGLGLGGLGHEDGGGYLYNSFQGHQGFQEIDHNSTIFGASNDSSSSTMNYQPGVITVFINGVATEVGRGPLDMKAMFGGDFMLYHSSGVPVQVNEYGFLVQSLQHGESYFLVPKPAT